MSVNTLIESVNIPTVSVNTPIESVNTPIGYLCGVGHPTLQVAPGARLPLPLRWSRVEDIRLRPLPKNGIGDASPINPKNPENVPGVSSPGLGEDGEATLYDYSDCSVLLPVARCVLLSFICLGKFSVHWNSLWNPDRDSYIIFRGEEEGI